MVSSQKPQGKHDNAKLAIFAGTGAAVPIIILLMNRGTKSIISINNVDVFALTPGESAHFLLKMANFGSFTIGQIYIRLRDPSNVFTQFPVGVSYVPPYFIGGVQYGPAKIGTVNILNQWSNAATPNSPLGFWADITNMSVYTTFLAPGETKNIVCGYYDPSLWAQSSYVTVNPAILPGTYTCYFDIIFAVTSGTIKGTPALTIPWNVTIA